MNHRARPSKSLVWLWALAPLIPSILYVISKPQSFAWMEEARFVLTRDQSFLTAWASEFKLRMQSGRITPLSSGLAMAISQFAYDARVFRIFRLLEIALLGVLTGELALSRLRQQRNSSVRFGLWISLMTILLARIMVLPIFILSLNELEGVLLTVGLLLCIYRERFPLAICVSVALPLFKEPFGILAFIILVLSKRPWRSRLTSVIPVSLVILAQYLGKTGYAANYGGQQIQVGAWPLLIATLGAFGLIWKFKSKSKSHLILTFFGLSVVYGWILFPWAGASWQSYYYIPSKVLGVLGAGFLLLEYLSVSNLGRLLPLVLVVTITAFSASMFQKTHFEVGKYVSYLEIARILGTRSVKEQVVFVAPSPEGAERAAQTYRFSFDQTYRGKMSWLQTPDQVVAPFPKAAAILSDLLTASDKLRLQRVYQHVDELGDYQVFYDPK